MSKNVTNYSRQVDLFPFAQHNGKYFPKSQVEIMFPRDISFYSYVRRLTSMTAIPANQAISQSTEIDFQLVAPNGVVAAIYLEMTLIELGGTTSSSFNPYNLFQRIDVEINGDVFVSLYPEILFYPQMIKRNYDEQARLSPAEAMSLQYMPVSPTLAAGGSRTVILKLPVFEQHPDLRNLSSAPLLRCYFNNPANVVTNGSANIGLTSFNILVEQINTPVMYRNIDKNYRYIEYTRFINPNINLQPNQQYVFQLNTFTGYSAYLMFFLRPAGAETNGNSWQTTVGNYTWQLNDDTNTIIAIQQYPLLNQNILNKFPSDNIIDVGAGNNLIQTAIFALDPVNVPNVPTGGYQFTTRENLIIYTNSTFTAGNYELYCLSAEYRLFTIHKDGSFSYTR